MTKMIKDIRIWNDNSQKDRVSNVVRVEFNFPVTWTIFSLDQLLKILELWIVGEEMKYPQSKGFLGRWMLYDRITKVFNETEVK